MSDGTEPGTQEDLFTESGSRAAGIGGGTFQSYLTAELPKFSVGVELNVWPSRPPSTVLPHYNPPIPRPAGLEILRFLEIYNLKNYTCHFLAFTGKLQRISAATLFDSDVMQGSQGYIYRSATFSWTSASRVI